jgi:hypothetical protein
MELRGLAQGGAHPLPSKWGGWDTPGFFLGGLLHPVFWKTRICPTLVVNSNKAKQQQKLLAHTARGSRGISFFLFYYYTILYLIIFNQLRTYFLQTPAISAHARLRQMRCWSSSPKKRKESKKKSNKSEEHPENRKQVLVDPGRHFPVPYTTPF